MSMCNFEEKVKTMTFENCKLFKRSFTTQGIGYTFNNERAEILLKEEFRSAEFSLNTARNPSMMKSTHSKHTLQVFIENNAEEVENYERISSNAGKLKTHKPREISMTLHNPKEPADKDFIPSIKIPLGHSTTFLIIPQAREIDDSAKELTESQRKCRLDEDTDMLDIFNVYTRIGCLFECKIKFSMQRCGCIPWYYPLNTFSKVDN